ncbi:uncharacterized protein LOC127865977 [Dreissena polymorpha]|uniref:uncharacterized protein LOC127865977 n=1 Tax=Dreissena polymorpha TaxID=45954 RepID=UPI002264F46E|nr:uncharacterized protein LOC127865977 [Dreissena polymorpha]
MAAPSPLKVQLFGHSFVRHLKDLIRHDSTLRFNLNLQGHPLVQYSGFSGARVETLHHRLTEISDFEPEIVVLIIGTNDIYDSSCSILSVANKIEDLMGPAKKTKKRSATTICSCCDNTTAKKSRSTPTSPPPSISTAIPVQETGTSTGPSNAHNGSGNNTIQHIQGVDFNPGPVPPNEVVLPHQQPPQVPGPVPPNAVVLPHQQPLQVPFNYSDDSSSEDEVDPPANLQEILSTHMMGLLPDTASLEFPLSLKRPKMPHLSSLSWV